MDFRKMLTSLMKTAQPFLPMAATAISTGIQSMAQAAMVEVQLPTQLLSITSKALGVMIENFHTAAGTVNKHHLDGLGKHAHSQKALLAG